MSDPPRKKKPKPRPRSVAAAEEGGTTPHSPPVSPPKGHPPRADKTPTSRPTPTPPDSTSQPSTAPPPSDPDDPGLRSDNSFLVFTALPSWLTSTIVHVVVLLAFALFTLPAIQRPDRDNELVLAEKVEAVEELEEFQDEVIDSVEFDSLETSDIMENAELVSEEPILSSAMDVATAALKVDLDPLGMTSVTSSELGQTVGAVGGDALSGRGVAARARMVAEGGGTPGSEAAVASALEWITNHQMPDGGWSVDHKKCPGCQGRCPDPGKKANSRNGATALALLPYLGTGQTHQEGKYKEVVEKGLTFLVRNIRLQGVRGSLVDPEGNYYSHGIAAIVLCEAYAMTKDKKLANPAQSVINEIVYAQDPIGGGWRYKPRMPGDTSVVGWQLMALKSANMAYLQVPRPTVLGAVHFLDSIQSKDGANYGYTDPSENWRNSTAAVGLLCRMYTGWGTDHPGIIAGVEQLSSKGPDDDDIYYNYYATQVMRHYGGDRWKKWNEKMRDMLVNSQERDAKSHRGGSWYFKGGHANDSGGRLYCTTMATMILEVYYRHLPLYQESAAEDEFPL